MVELFVPTVTLPLPASLIVLGCGGHLASLHADQVPGQAERRDLEYGIFVALIAAAVATYGGYAKMHEA